MPKTAKGTADYILPLYMNSLSGRMIRLPAPVRRKREILLIAGQHTSIERISGLAEYLNRYGAVTSPDLPGFGGMDNFYKIGEKPTLDNMADYLAAFVKLRYRNRRFTVIAVSYGFAAVTRMLQRYPEIAKKVDLIISISGVVNKKDFKWQRHNMVLMHIGLRILSMRLLGFLAQRTFIRAPIIKLLYKIAEAKHPKLKGVNEAERASRIDFEIKLWKSNDFRTWLATCVTMFNLELGNTHVDLPVYHVAVNDDHYFNHLSVEQHMRQIYRDFELIKTKLPAHAPTILATLRDVAPFVPPRVRGLLRKEP